MNEMRGYENGTSMTVGFSLHIFHAVGKFFGLHQRFGLIVACKDALLSGYMFNRELLAGHTSVRLEAIVLGPALTPAISMHIWLVWADGDAIISTSHDPNYDNVVKLFGLTLARLCAVRVAHAPSIGLLTYLAADCAERGVDQPRILTRSVRFLDRRPRPSGYGRRVLALAGGDLSRYQRPLAQRAGRVPQKERAICPRN